MTLEQLRIFVEVARRQHVTRAAEALNLTQSAVSASIAALEERHGVRLFDRVGRGIELAEAGRLFVAEAEAILARVETAELALADVGQHTGGRVRVHASQTVASYWLPERLVQLHDRHPRIAIDLHVGNTAQVARAVAEGAADLGVVEGAVADDALAKQVVAHDTLVLVVAAGHRWADRTRIAPRAFGEVTWILREPGSGTRSEFEAHLAEIGRSVAELDVTLEFPSNEAVLAAVAAGQSATVLSRLAVEPLLATGRVAAIPLDARPRRYVALWHRERHRTRAARALLDLIAETAPDP